MAHERYPLRKSRTCAFQAAKSSVACSPLPDRWVRLGRPLRRRCSNSWRLNATSSIGLRSCGVDTGVKLREGSYTPMREGKGVTLRAGSETPMGAAKVVQNLVEASSDHRLRAKSGHHVCSGHIKIILLPLSLLWTYKEYKNYYFHYLCSGHKIITIIDPIIVALDISRLYQILLPLFLLWTYKDYNTLTIIDPIISALYI